MKASPLTLVNTIFNSIQTKTKGCECHTSKFLLAQSQVTQQMK